MGAGGHREPPLTLSASHSQCVTAPIQLFGQHPPGSDQLQGAVPLRLQVRDVARVWHPPCHLLSPPADPKGWRVPLEASAAAGTVPGAAPLSYLRSDMVSVLGSYYYDDGCEPCGTDTFSREPFIVKFFSPTTREQSWCWGLPRPGTGSPLRGGAHQVGRSTLETSSGTPLGSFTAVGPSPTRRCLGVLGTCPAWQALPALSHHVPSPIMHRLQLCAISLLQLFPIVSHIPSPATSHLILYPTICLLQLRAVSYHLPSPITSHHLPSPITWHLPSPPITLSLQQLFPAGSWGLAQVVPRGSRSLPGCCTRARG